MQCYAWPRAPEAFVDDLDCPYVTPADRPFVWLRARQLGGRWLIPGHGRQYYRLGPDDFAPARRAERALAAAGGRIRPMVRRGGAPTWTERQARQSLLGFPIANSKSSWNRRPARPLCSVRSLRAGTARVRCWDASLRRSTPSKPRRGLGGFLSAAARSRGRSKWTGQVACAASSGSTSEAALKQRACAPLVFLCASALESTRLLLLSRSPASPDGLGATSGVLGRYLMDHVLRASGAGPPLFARALSRGGRCLYLPRFDARDLPAPGPSRGFGVQVKQTSASGGWSTLSLLPSARCCHGRRTG